LNSGQPDFQIGAPMEKIMEKFTLEITDIGISIRDSEEKSLHFTASEALMFLDILRNEEPKLKKMAEDASPTSIQIKVS